MSNQEQKEADRFSDRHVRTRLVVLHSYHELGLKLKWLPREALIWMKEEKQCN